jgi:hypothetical protein
MRPLTFLRSHASPEFTCHEFSKRKAARAIGITIHADLRIGSDSIDALDDVAIPVKHVALHFSMTISHGFPAVNSARDSIESKIFHWFAKKDERSLASRLMSVKAKNVGSGVRACAASS